MRPKVSEIAELAAADCLDRVRSDGTPPLDLHVLADKLGVHAIRLTSDFGDGRLEDDGRTRTILIQRRAGRARQRFTLAHELGHLYLRSHARDLLTDLDPRSEEHFCNAFAAALLLPQAWLDRQEPVTRPSLNALRWVSEEADVSMASCLVRLKRHAQWRSSLLRWRWDEQQWRLLAVTGLPTFCDEVRSVDATRRALDVVSRAPADDAAGVLWLGIGMDSRKVPAEISVRGLGALALVDLTQTFPNHSLTALSEPIAVLTDGMLDPRSGLDEFSRAAAERWSSSFATQGDDWLFAGDAETALTTHIVDRAIRTWLFQVLSHRDRTLPLGAWRLLELPRIAVTDKEAAREASTFLYHFMAMVDDDGIEWSACVSAAEATNALMDGLVGQTQRLRDAIRLAGRVLGELIPLGKTRVLAQLLQEVVRELPIWSFKWESSRHRDRDSDADRAATQRCPDSRYVGRRGV